MATGSDSHERIASLRVRLNARAAGWWRVEGDHVVLVAFDAAPDMPAEVSIGFVSATTTVSLARLDLGVVRAAVTNQVAVSRLDELPADTGSGLWLRRFGASRSVAVPTPDGVVSVALGAEPEDEIVAGVIRAAR
jgi:hypothetical protein